MMQAAEASNVAFVDKLWQARVALVRLPGEAWNCLNSIAFLDGPGLKGFAKQPIFSVMPYLWRLSLGKDLLVRGSQMRSCAPCNSDALITDQF